MQWFYTYGSFTGSFLGATLYYFLARSGLVSRSRKGAMAPSVASET